MENLARRGGRAPLSSCFEALIELDRDRLAGFCADRATQVGFDRQLVGAIAECHERAAERVAVDPAANLHQPAGADGAPLPEISRPAPPVSGPVTSRSCMTLPMSSSDFG
jgi:hypothetical protein